MQTISGKDWANFADEDDSVWELIVGAKVSHSEFGEGEITKIESPIGLPIVSVSFSTRTEKISAASFRSGRLFVFINDLLDRKVKEWLSYRPKEDIEKERIGSKLRKDYRLLIDKYGVSEDFLFGENMLRLSKISDKLGNRESLSTSDLNWLEIQKLDGFIARNSILLFEKNGEPGELARACKHFREAKLPDEVIARTTDLHSAKIPNEKDRAMLLTTRAAAFRDKGDLCQAKTLALEALHTFETFHPYNLLGAIFWDQGAHIESENYFKKAETLGSPPENYLGSFGKFY